MKVEFFKKESPYKDNKDGKEKIATSFFVKCGDELVQVEPVYHKNKDGTPDRAYPSRKAILRVFATPLPDDYKDSCS